MKKIFFLSFICALAVAACACSKPDPLPDQPDPETPVFKLDSYNGHFVQALSDAYDTFEEKGALPGSVNVEGLQYVRGKYIQAACILLDKITSDPEHWQDVDIELIDAAAGNEYRYNTFDPDVIDMAHVRYMADRLLTYTREHAGSMPNYVTFPSADDKSPGYLPQLTMVVTQHDNQMNLRACAVVLARVFNHFVKNEGQWPESVSSWPASYLDAVANCPKDDALVKSTLAAAIKGLAADVTRARRPRPSSSTPATSGSGRTIPTPRKAPSGPSTRRAATAATSRTRRSRCAARPAFRPATCTGSATSPPA